MNALASRPEAIGMTVERVNDLDFLTVEEKAGLFYDDAARFQELSEEVMAGHRQVPGQAEGTR